MQKFGISIAILSLASLIVAFGCIVIRYSGLYIVSHELIIAILYSVIGEAVFAGILLMIVKFSGKWVNNVFEKTS